MTLKRWGLVAVAGVLVIVIGGALFVRSMEQDEARHSQFYETGKMVNQYLSDYASALKSSHKAGDLSTVTNYYSSEYASPARGDWTFEKTAPVSDIAVSMVRATGGRDFGKTDIHTELTDYLMSLTDVSRVKCKIDMIEELDPEKSVTLRVKYILDGVDAEGQALQDRRFLRWRLVNEGVQGGAFDWKIVSDELIEGVRVSGTREGYADVDPAELGIDYVHARDPKLDPEGLGAGLKFQMVQYAFGGASAADYNSDGHVDLFFADGLRSRLYRNDGPTDDGRAGFTDVTSEAGLEGIDQANNGLFADFNNDGYKDLFVVRYLAPAMYYQGNPDGTFTDRSSEMGLDFTAPAMSATVMDYDLDGFLDIYVGVYGNAFETIPRLFFFARNGGANRLFHNDGGQGFTDVSEESGAGDTGWTLAVATGDYDGDSYPDLATSNDFGRKNLYRNNGDGTFTDVAKEAGVLDLSGGMGITFGDFNDDGLLDIYTSNIKSNQRWFGENVTINQYLRNVIKTKWAWEDLGEYSALYSLFGDSWTELGKMSGEGNSLFQNNGDGTFTELKDSNTNQAGWGWAVSFLDIDNDTDLDIYAANGWISQDPTSDL